MELFSHQRGGTTMNAHQNEILSPEWPGDFNETMRGFLEEYRRQASRSRHQLALARLTFGLTAGSAFLVAAWPMVKSAIS